MSQNLFSSLSQETWEKLSRVAVKGAEYDSPERQPHPKCLQGTRVHLLNHICTTLNNRRKSQISWLHSTTGSGKSAVAFTVAERMRALSVTNRTTNEKRLGGTFFFSRKHTKRCTTGYFFATLAYQLATNFPSIREDVNKVICEDPALLGPDKSLRKQMNALFLQHLRMLRFRLAESLPVMFVIDAIDECISETEVTDLISLLGEVLRDPDVPAIHILLTSCFEPHIREAIRKLDERLVDEIPMDGAIFSSDDADVDRDIYIFLQHSFTQLQHRYPGFPQPSGDQLTRLVSLAGRRFIVASTMIKFIVSDGKKDPHDRLELMLKFTCDSLPGTPVYKLYDLILSTCADPKRAYQHLSIVAALVDPLPIPQISKLLGTFQGSDVETTLVQLRSIINIPVDRLLPVNISHSSVCDYALDPSKCGLPGVQDIIPPHVLLAESLLRLIRDVPIRTTLPDALSKLVKQSQAIELHDPQSLKRSLAFIVQPPEPMQALISLLWLRGYRNPDLYFWLETLDGRAWLQTQDGKNWLQTQCGYTWLQTQHGSVWLQTQDGLNWLPTQAGRRWLRNGGGRLWLSTEEGLGWLVTPEGRDWLQTEDAHSWLQDQAGREWLQDQGGGEWLQTHGGREWLRLPGGREWLQLQGGRAWLQTHSGRVWLYSPCGEKWLMSENGRNWLQSENGQQWLQSQGGEEWLRTLSGWEWVQTLSGQEWLQSQPGRTWLKSQATAPTPLQKRTRRAWLQSQDEEASKLFLIDRASSRKQFSDEGEPNFLQSRAGREWLRTEGGHSWLQTQDGRDWQSTPEASVWVAMEEFSSTVAVIRQYSIVPELRMLPAFQVIQQFRNLPDVLMFPAFLALRLHSTPELPQDRLLPDMEIVRAMEAFMVFAQEAREQSRSTSGALDYACQNWAFHLSRAPSLWDDDFNHLFRLFWDRHLLSWLERQWILKGLHSCLVILSEGQRLAQAHLQAP